MKIILFFSKSKELVALGGAAGSPLKLESTELIKKTQLNSYNGNDKGGLGSHFTRR